MHTNLKLKIITPAGLYFEGTADRIEAPGQMGLFHVLPNHASMIAGLEKGKLIIEKNKQEMAHAIAGGILQVEQGVALVLTEKAVAAKITESD